jgi:hypothetical protein
VQVHEVARRLPTRAPTGPSRTAAGLRAGTRAADRLPATTSSFASRSRSLPRA